MRNKQLLALGCAFFGLSVPYCDAQETRPTTGKIVNKRENASINYECLSSTTTSIKCTFVQVTVSKDKPGSPEELGKAVAGFNPEKDASFCKNLPQAAAQLEKGQESRAFSAEAEKEAALITLREMQSFCAKPDQAAARKMMQFVDNQKMRTCKVWTWNFEQVFNWNLNTGRWEAQNGPNGDCGKISIMSFEPEKFGEFIFWNYRQRNIVTNPKGNMFGDMACSTIPEEVIEYNWKSRTIRPQCEFVEFGLF